MIKWAIVWMTLTASGPAEVPVDAPSPADPYAANACVQCHRDLSGRSSEIVLLEWKHSVHYAAKVGCDGCHGGDPSVRREDFRSDEGFKQAAHTARSTDFLVMERQDDQFVSAARGRSVSYFCGKCHGQIKEKHLGSPHGDFGDPTCLYCHGQGSHKITDPSADILDIRGRTENGRCSPCHKAATMEVVARIKQTLSETQEQIDASGDLYEQLEEWGYHNLELEQLHDHAAEVSSQLRQIFHSFNMREINNFASEIQAIVERTVATHELIARLRRQRVQQATIGGVVVVMLLCFAGLLVYYKHAFLDEHDTAEKGEDDASRGRESED